MRKPLLPVLVLIFLLVLSGGCRMEKAHLIVTIDWYEYDSSTGVINVDIRVRNDGEKDIASGLSFWTSFLNFTVTS
ncbi:MAG: hypothetical protein ACE5IT_00635 [bacterium]